MNIDFAQVEGHATTTFGQVRAVGHGDDPAFHHERPRVAIMGSECDPDAFVIITAAYDVMGRGFKLIKAKRSSRGAAEQGRETLE